MMKLRLSSLIIIFAILGCKKTFTDTQLLGAASTGDYKYITDFLQRGGDVNARLSLGFGSHHFTLLLNEASRTGHADLVLLLLQNGADPKAKDSLGATALNTVICSEMTNSVKACFSLLLTNKETLELANKGGDTPLVSACRYQDADVVDILLKQGANPNVRDMTGNTPLHLCKTAKTAKLLLEAGADPLSKNKEGLTPADKASQAHLGEMAFLISEWVIKSRVENKK